MREPVILAVDQGTSATKDIAVGADGAIIAHSSQPAVRRKRVPYITSSSTTKIIL